MPQKTKQRLSVPVIGFDVVCHGLGLSVAVVMVVTVAIVGRTNVVHLVHATTFVAPLIWSVSRNLNWLAGQRTRRKPD